MKLVRELALSAMRWPQWVSSGLLPNGRNLWLFGRWMGDSYSDNSRALFENVLENMPKVQAVRRTRNSGITVQR